VLGERHVVGEHDELLHEVVPKGHLQGGATFWSIFLAQVTTFLTKIQICDWSPILWVFFVQKLQYICMYAEKMGWISTLGVNLAPWGELCPQEECSPLCSPPQG
jgi:hypothetical protein